MRDIKLLMKGKNADMIRAMPRKPRKAPVEGMKPSRPVRDGLPLHVWINTDLMQAFEQYCKSTRRTKTAEIEMIMEELLRKAGMWPPQT